MDGGTKSGVTAAALRGLGLAWLACLALAAGAPAALGQGSDCFAEEPEEEAVRLAGQWGGYAAGEAEAETGLPLGGVQDPTGLAGGRGPLDRRHPGLEIRPAQTVDCKSGIEPAELLEPPAPAEAGPAEPAPIPAEEPAPLPPPAEEPQPAPTPTPAEAEAPAPRQEAAPQGCACAPAADPPAPWTPAAQAASPASEPIPLLPAAVPAGAAAVVGGLLLWKLLAALLARRRPGLHPRAQSILEAVYAAPGLSLRGVRDATGLANGVALHHLSTLLAEGRIVAHRLRNTVRFFENHGRYARTWRQAAALRDPLNARLHRWLADNPGATQGAVVAGSRAWGWGRTLTQKRLAWLEEAGLVERARAGRAVLYTPRPAEVPIPGVPVPGGLPAPPALPAKL